jgi:hypothetical protein
MADDLAYRIIAIVVGLTPVALTAVVLFMG